MLPSAVLALLSHAVNNRAGADVIVRSTARRTLWDNHFFIIIRYHRCRVPESHLSRLDLASAPWDTVFETDAALSKTLLRSVRRLWASQRRRANLLRPLCLATPRAGERGHCHLRRLPIP